MRFTSPRLGSAWLAFFGLAALSAACGSGSSDDAAIVTVVSGTGGSSGSAGSHAGGAAASGAGGEAASAGHAGTAGAGGAHAGAGGASQGGMGGSTGGHGGVATGGASAGGSPGAGGDPAGTGGKSAGAGGDPTMGTGGSPAMGAGGDPTMGAGGMPMSNGCDSLKFPSVELATVPHAAMTAEYDALGVTGCESPKCFLDVTDLKSPDGTAHDIHVNVSPNFQLYELVGTDVDPNGTGNVDPGNAYSTHVLLSVDLVVHLQKLREAYGGPVSITSGFRSPEHQHSICQSICGADQCPVSGGPVTCAKNSRHMWGAAADMDLKYEAAANAAGFAFVYHENGGTGPHLHVDMQSCE